MVINYLQAVPFVTSDSGELGSHLAINQCGRFAHTGGTVSKKAIWVLSVCLAIFSVSGLADDGAKRSLKTKVAPSYPELAKKMNVAGTVKVEVSVAANGSVKMAKATGGHPLLIDAAERAAKQCKYEAGGESVETLTFNFDPNK